MDSLDTSETTKKSCINLDSNRIKVTPDDFEFGKYLGKGGSAQVYHARKKTGKDQGTIVAMKVIRKFKIIGNQKKIDNIALERCMLAKIEHPFVIKMYYAFETNDTFYFGLEYMPNGDLYNHLEKVQFLDEDTARLYTGEIILALKSLHANRIIFRDLKPENILIDAGGHVKLSDFGLAKRLRSEDDQTYTFCGTIDYMAPEILLKSPYTRAVDWWSVGVMLFDMLTGFHPFRELDNQKATIYNIKYGIYSFKNSLAEVSPKAQDLIYKLLKFTPIERLGAGPTDAEEVMSHDFFNKINFVDLLACKYKPLMNRPNKPFKETFRKRLIPNKTIKDSEKRIFEDFDYIAPCLLDLEEDLDKTG